MNAVLWMTPVNVIAEIDPSNTSGFGTLSGPAPAIVPPAHLSPLPAVTGALNVCVPPMILIGLPPLNDVLVLNALLPPKTIGCKLPVTNEPL